MLFTSLLVGLLITLYLRPEINPGTFVDLGIVVSIEVVAFVLARYITTKSFWQNLLRMLLISLFLSTLIIFLIPSVNISFDALYAGVTGIEFLGFTLAYFATKE